MLSRSYAICPRCGGLESEVTLCRKCSHSLPLCMTHEPSANGLLNQLRSFTLPASSAAVQNIQSVIDVAQTDISNYDSLMRQLSVARIELLKHISYRKSLLAPIRKLPPELLVEILKWACVDEKNDLAKGELSSMPALTISGVCYRWRQLILSMPEAWSTLEVCIDHIRQKPLRSDEKFSVDIESSSSQRGLLQIYLENSKTAPLSLSIGTSGDDHHTWGGGDDEIVHDLGRHSKRWSHLTIDLMAFAHMWHVKGPLKSLQSLELSGTWSRRSVYPQFVNVFGSAINIKELSVPSAVFGNVHFNIPWQGLCSVTLDDAVMDDLLRLADIPTLRKLSFCGIGSRNGAPELSSVMHFRSLEYLDISVLYQHPFSAAYFLGLMKAPNLGHLNIHSNSIPGGRAEILDTAIKQLVEISNCSITSLELCGVRIQPLALQATLKLLPDLQALNLSSLSDDRMFSEVDHSPVTMSLFGSLLWQTDIDFYPLPNLEELWISDTFRNCGNPFNWVFPNNLFSMLEQRVLPVLDNGSSSHPPQLRSVRLSFKNDGNHCYASKDFIQKIRLLASASSTKIEVLECREGFVYKSL